MPSSNGGRGGYKNKKDNGKDAAMIENVSEKCGHFSFRSFSSTPSSYNGPSIWREREIFVPKISIGLPRPVK